MTAETSFFAGNMSAIWSPIDRVTVVLDGEKFPEIPEDVGVDSVQLTAQHSRAASARGVFSEFRALSQHFIIWLLGACSGIPDTAPTARVNSRTPNVIRLII